jgi:hypothetical protein
MPCQKACSRTEMVERVAKAIWNVSREPEHEGPTEDKWHEATEDWRENMRAHARAAITAMRTPTPKMLKAAKAAMSPGKRPTQNRVGCKAKHGIRYRAMIDAALKETGNAG